MTAFLLNAWHVATLPEKLGEGVMPARRLLDRPVLLYRAANGDPVAMLDRCPHRFPSLSTGRLVGGEVECG